MLHSHAANQTKAHQETPQNINRHNTSGRQLKLRNQLYIAFCCQVVASVSFHMELPTNNILLTIAMVTLLCSFIFKYYTILIWHLINFSNIFGFFFHFLLPNIIYVYVWWCILPISWLGNWLLDYYFHPYMMRSCNFLFKFKTSCTVFNLISEFPFCTISS